MMRSTRRTQHGLLTITELIMAAAITALLAGVLLVMGMSSQQALMTSDAKLDSQSDAQHIINRLSEDLRSTSRTSLIAETNGGFCAANNFRIDPIDPDGPGPLTAPAQVRYVFTPTPAPNVIGSLVRLQAGNMQIVSIRVAAFTPTCDINTGLVTLQVTTQATTSRGRQVVQTLNTNVWVTVP